MYTADLDAEAADGSALSDDECERAARFRFDRDRRRFVAGRSALRSLVGSYLDVAPDEVAFEYGPQGKPFVPGATLSFNVSHSGGQAVYAFGSGLEVGVDVELLDHARYGDDVAERFFSPQEVATLRGLAPAMRPDAFLRCWTRKEAFIKARGEGLSLPLDEFRRCLRARRSSADSADGLVRAGAGGMDPQRHLRILSGRGRRPGRALDAGRRRIQRTHLRMIERSRP